MNISDLTPIAFWGESDDGSSDIEVALQPTPRHTDDDFDFCD